MFDDIIEEEIFILDSHNFSYEKQQDIHTNNSENIEYPVEECHPFQRTIDIAQAYYLPIMIFIGLIGNTLSCIVFLKTHLKMRSSSFYLAALSCADSGFLIALLLVWISGQLDVPIFNVNGCCQSIVYISSVCSFLSVWLIVTFTVERFIAVQYPLHRPRLCTVKRAKTMILYLVIAAAFMNSYVFFTSGIIESDGVQICEMLPQYYEFMKIINILDFLITFVVPIFLIITMNTLIVINLFQFSKQFRRNNAMVYSMRKFSNEDRNFIQTSRSSSNNNYSNESCSNNAIGCNQIGHHGLGSSHHSSNSCGKLSDNHTKSIGNSRCSQYHIQGNTSGLISSKMQQSITKMLLLISSAFVLLNLPSYCIRLYVFVFTSIWMKPPPIKLWCVQQIFMYLYYTNFSINFLFYSMYGITFRRCLWQILRSKFKTLRKWQNPSVY